MPDIEQQERDLQRLKDAVTVLMEHFDSVQIFANKYLSLEEGTVVYTWGDGNWCARRGQIRDFQTLYDAKERRS